MINDIFNLQYTNCIVKMDVVDNIIDHGCNVGALPIPGDLMGRDQRQHAFLALLGAGVTGFDTDRDAFIGNYRTYANPLVVETGQCTGSLAIGDNGCGTLQADLELKPGETKELVVLLGIGAAGVEGKQTAAEFPTAAPLRAEFARLKHYWQERLSGLTVRSPDAELNSMLNMWSPYNCLVTYNWSRAASLLYYAYQRDGFAYRDTVQDFMGVFHLIPAEARQAAWN